MSTQGKIGLITANILFWAVIIMSGLYFEWVSPPFDSNDGTYTPTMLWGNFFNAIVLYVNALWLYPNRKKIKLPYWFLALLLVLLTSILEALVDYQLIFYLNLEEKFDLMLDGLPRFGYILGSFIQNIFIHSIWLILSFAIVFLFERRKNERIQKNLEEEKLKAELKFLRAQINPHFLFNGINSVYFLIDDQPNIAKSTLLKFSDLLRYQLYECQDDSISLEKELAHVKSYVDMERIRRGDDVTISLDITDSTKGNLFIAPLLFTPFLENAFKFVSNHDDGELNTIDISSNISDNVLHFQIENSIDDQKEYEVGGIGITNVKKRLSLLYPERHSLEHFQKGDRYIATLQIEL